MSVTIKNNPIRGGIELITTTTKNTIDGITSFVINRKEYGQNKWMVVGKIDVSTVEDLRRNMLDISTISSKRYTYSIDIMNETTIVESQTYDTVQFKFEGLFIGNDEKQFVAGSNFQTDTERNTEVNYVTTLGSKYPYRVSNGMANYTTGSSSGLFLQVTDDGKKFKPDYDHSYSTEVLDFLTDGSSKILKTDDGQAWYVSIDDDTASPFNEHFSGMNEVKFSWTEIGEIPEKSVVTI